MRASFRRAFGTDRGDAVAVARSLAAPGRTLGNEWVPRPTRDAAPVVAVRTLAATAPRHLLEVTPFVFEDAHRRSECKRDGRGDGKVCVDSTSKTSQQNWPKISSSRQHAECKLVSSNCDDRQPTNHETARCYRTKRNGLGVSIEAQILRSPLKRVARVATVRC